MTVAPHVTYPGVYIQEVESDVRTIAPVATATTAFVGRAKRGPVNTPIVINGFGDFQTRFGGLWEKSKLGFAVRDFFLNGGGQAVIVRVFHPDVKAEGAEATDPEPLSKAQLAIPGGLVLEAAEPGSWGNDLAARITKIRDETILGQVAEQLGVETDELFNLTIHDKGTGATENFASVTLVDSPRQVAAVLENGSDLVRVAATPDPLKTPAAHPAPASAGKEWQEARAHTDVADTGKATDGRDLDKVNDGEEAPLPGSEGDKTGLYALEHADIFNILVIPPYKSTDGVANADVEAGVLTAAAAYCEKRRAILLLDPPSGWTSKEDATDSKKLNALPSSPNAALYFPRVRQANPLRQNQLEVNAPSGVVAGIMARTDATRGVWKAPAGLEATIRGVHSLLVPLTDAENGELNPLGVNCLRTMPAVGHIVWGARTRKGDDRLADQWKYLPVRRTALYIEESLYRGTQWAVFEPNDEPLWSQLRLNIGVFMHGLFRQGAFQGLSPKQAYFVKCDSTTTTQADIDRGIVNIIVGFAPLKPAEFVVIYIQQITGDLATG